MRSHVPREQPIDDTACHQKEHSFTQGQPQCRTGRKQPKSVGLAQSWDGLAAVQDPNRDQIRTFSMALARASAA
jgi:hypothetical protein